jgi:hypothetical protein
MDEETLKHISKTLDEILIILKKPRDRRTVFVETVATAITILGIIGIIDIVINWLGG